METEMRNYKNAEEVREDLSGWNGLAEITADLNFSHLNDPEGEMQEVKGILESKDFNYTVYGSTNLGDYHFRAVKANAELN